jgi:hypothetical protein
VSCFAWRPQGQEGGGAAPKKTQKGKKKTATQRWAEEAMRPGPAFLAPGEEGGEEEGEGEKGGGGDGPMPDSVADAAAVGMEL